MSAAAGRLYGMGAEELWDVQPRPGGQLDLVLAERHRERGAETAPFWLTFGQM